MIIHTHITQLKRESKTKTAQHKRESETKTDDITKSSCYFIYHHTDKLILQKEIKEQKTLGTMLGDSITTATSIRLLYLLHGGRKDGSTSINHGSSSTLRIFRSPKPSQVGTMVDAW